MFVTSESVFVAQDDTLLPNLTTKETLMFSARLRLPGSMKIAEKRLRVDSLIGILGLQACADTRVGNEKVLQSEVPFEFFLIFFFLIPVLYSCVQHEFCSPCTKQFVRISLYTTIYEA